MWNLELNKLAEILTYNPKEPLIFSSGLFLFLFAGFSLVYYFVRNRLLLRIIYVTLFSYFFYYKSSGVFVSLLFLSSSCDYMLGNLLAKQTIPYKKKLLVIFTVVINLGLLGYFKYANFFAEMVFDLLNKPFTPYSIFLPVGISFFTFQSLSYTIDIYRGELKPVKRYIDYIFFVSFFPQLVAGPIVRAKDFIPQIYRSILVTKEMYATGLYLIAIGLFKKAIISDYISVNFVERIFDNPNLYSGIENLLGVYGYTLQIYCDFSGYSDMAIGIALLMGFHFNINFNSPYKAISITDFWRRWHISLSTWLRDYLYISLGGNRKGKLRTNFNLLITMIIGGLWHGASVRFIIWGAIHGVALVIHKLWLKITKTKGSIDTMPWWRKALGVLITFHVVCFSWIFFRSDSMEIVSSILHQIVYDFHGELLWQIISEYQLVMLLIAIGYFVHFMPDAWERNCKETYISLPFIYKIVFIYAVIFLIFQIKSAEVQPFIYFQF